jgi:hypothetical protein
VLTVVTMDMWRRSARRKKKGQKAESHRSSQRTGGTCSRGFERSSASSETQEILMLLHRLAASTSPGAAGTVTQSSALIGSTSASQSSALEPPTALSPGIHSWYLDSDAFFHMTPHSAHLSSLRPSSRHCIVHTVDGSPLSVAGRGALSSDSFHAPDVSLIPDLTKQLMSAGQIADHDCHVILDPDVCYIQDRRTGHLVSTGPVVVIHIVFGSLTDFIFLPLCPPVLSALLVLLHPRRHLLSGIIIWVIFLAPGYLLCFIEVF